MHKIKIGLLYFSLIFVVFCSTKNIITSKIITKDGIDILYGEISKEQLFFDFPVWKKIYDTYEIKKTDLQLKSNIQTKNAQIDIFLGTWCGDSKREVPRFLKIIDETDTLKDVKVNLYALDRKKKMGNGLATKNYIDRVATFIIKYNGSEIGRIVEFPLESLESDISTILNSIEENEDI